ncbi:DedA family protein [Bradyrhizobium sp. WSM3983]|uniref:DedA family protein n=1 Tax=Bradyrhizobium sp. WSM3983 TaxID=1038867 RepID=UPI0004254936|nr:DedA family protein [Bradyrhizobium sp. WSM3983]
MTGLSDLPAFVSDLAGWGLLGLMLCAAAEKLVPIVPSYGVLIVLGMFVVPDFAALPWALAATTAGSTLGSLIWYAAGRWFGPQRGEALVQRAGRYLSLRVEKYRQLTGSYHRNQFWITVSSQVIPLVRVYMAFPAGVVAIPLTCFTTATFVGALAWNAPFLVLGYGLRESHVDPSTAASTAIIGIVVVEVMFALAFRFIRGRA